MIRNLHALVFRHREHPNKLLPYLLYV
jgi:hypothetical protein